MTTKQPFPQASPSIPEAGFVDRRDPNRQRKSPGLERRQFSDGRADLSSDAAELGQAIDQYKLENCRRFISYEEMLSVVHSLGYKKSLNPSSVRSGSQEKGKN